MHCPACRQEVVVGARFCAACGTRLAPACVVCGAELPAAARFCPACGGAVGARPAVGAGPAVSAGPAAGVRTPDTYTPPHLAQRILTSRAALQGERKPVTVLFCDLVGSTAIAERLGPDAMHDLLNRFFETALAEVHRYEGTVNQFLGDGFMALFGAPLAHEDHARRAALAALGLARAFATPLVLDRGVTVALTVRMGLNTGLVVVGAIGDNLRMDYTAVGDCTHLAARLQQAAAPGTIVVSQATARQLDAHLALEPLGALEVRGLSEPVTAFRLTGARASPAEVGGRTRTTFVGREREAASLQSLVTDLARGQGRVAGIVGEPGVGKSRLLGELRQTIGDHASWFEGRCLSYGAAIPYLPVLDLLRGVCGIADADTPEQASAHVHATLDALGLDAESRAPALLQLLGLKPADGEATALEGDALLGRTLDTLRQLWLRTSARRPLVLVVEDLHWIDPASERCLAGLAESLGGAAVLLLATYRPGYRPAWIDRSYATQISLAPLGHDESRRMVRFLAESLAHDATLTQLILDKAEGNPFFLEELVHAVGDEPGRPFAVPDSVQGVLAARIDRLPESAKLLLQTAAVLGREFSESLLRAVADAPDRVDADLRELTRLEFLHERAGAEERAYVFKHALTQDVAYATLVAPRRRALHHRAAEALAALEADRQDELAPMLAHHYLEAEAWAEATVHARRAAQIASRAWANPEALARYDQAVLAAERAGRPAAERRALLEARAAVCTVLGRFDPARVDLEAALALAHGDAAAQGRVLSALGELWGGHRDYARGLDLTRQAVTLLGTTDDRPALAGARAQLGVMLLNIVRMTESRDELETALMVYESLADARGQARVLEILGMNLMLSGELEPAAALLERVIPKLRALGDRRAEAGALCSQGAVLIMQRGLAVGLQSLQRALEVSRTIEARGDEAFAHALSSEMRAWFGELDAAAAEAAQALTIARGLGHLEWTAYGLSILGRVHAECGDVAGARVLHDEEAVLTRQLGGYIWIADAIANIGQDLVCAGDLDEGRRHLLEALTIAGECREKMMFPLLQLAACELRAERPDEALAVVARFREECGGYPALLVEARRLEAEAWRIQGRTGEAEAAFRAVIAESDAFQYEACRWHAALGLAEILRVRGESDEARRHASGVQAALERVARGLPPDPLGRAFRQSELFRDAVRLAGSAVTT